MIENESLKLIRPFYYSDSKIGQTKIMKIKGCKLVEINGKKHIELPLAKDRFLFIPAGGIVQIESKYESTK